MVRSRVTTTRVLAEAIAASETKPAFLCGNGSSWYGDRGDTPLIESEPSTEITVPGRHIPLSAIRDAATAVYDAAIRTPLVRLDVPGPRRPSCT